MSNAKVRVRFAPSPTGPLHIGGVRTALYNYLFAKKHGGDFILRVEDTDQKRFVQGAEDYIIESLKWAGIEPSEGQGFYNGDFGPYKQSERKLIYQKHVQVLLDKGFAYYAFDTPEELNAQREVNPNWKYDYNTRGSLKNSLNLSDSEVNKLKESSPYTIRLMIPENRDISFTDAVRGSITINTENVDDKVIFKSDGLPTYHLANIVDDHLMQISHVIRGEEWLPSTPLHVLLYEYFEWEMPTFAHLPLLLKPDGKGKLSKRDGDRLGFPVFPLDWKDPNTSEIFNGYREQGYLSEAFINMLAFLGWNPGTEEELFSLEQLVASFSLDRVGKSGAKFDADKAKWFNEQYLKKLSNLEIASYLKSELPPGLSLEDAKLETIAAMMKERVTFVKDIYLNAPYFFHTPKTYDEKTIKKKWKEDSPEIVKELSERFSASASFDALSLKSAFESYVEDKGLGFGKAMIAIRLTITGKGGGPDLFETLEFLGKEEVLKRLSTYSF